ncbi:ciliogenesis and planar polarity effector 2 isoform X1 [Paroedura picta]|uniref:ciliogenesis and planar polarity effector 2 isoform X1 n=1 Tax=Paroedura picta TaxID=143630 RepID=UPI0040565107
MAVRPGSLLDLDWHKSQEAKRYFGTILQRNKRKPFGLLERPVLPPQAAVDIASYKVFVSGRSSVGKTSLVASLGGLQVPSKHHETTGIETTTVYWPAKLRESGRPLFFKFTFWDSGESVLKKFDHILPACTEKVDGCLLLFSFTDRASFDDLPSQISRLTGAAKEAVKIVIGTKYPLTLGPIRRGKHFQHSQTHFGMRFDQFAHTDVTEHDVATFCHTWDLPVLRAKSISPLDSHTGLTEVSHLLNGLAEHLWRQDQWAAGLLLPPSPGSKDVAPAALAGGSTEFLG